jgi:hypothetical protein
MFKMKQMSPLVDQLIQRALRPQISLPTGKFKPAASLFMRRPEFKLGKV